MAQVLLLSNTHDIKNVLTQDALLCTRKWCKKHGFRYRTDAKNKYLETSKIQILNHRNKAQNEQGHLENVMHMKTSPVLGYAIIKGSTFLGKFGEGKVWQGRYPEFWQKYFKRQLQVEKNLGCSEADNMKC